MSATNQTPNFGLSQFVQSDHATWYGDYNSDMLKIDTALHNQSGISDTLTEQVGTNTQDISAMKQNINGLQNGLNSTNTAVQQTQARVTTLENEQGVTDNRLDNLEDDVSRLTSNDQWVIVGDSYGDYGGRDFMTTLIALNPNRTIYNVCVGGSSFAGTIKYLTNLQNKITEIDIDKVSKVLVIGGWNDRLYTTSQILQNMNAFISYCTATFTRATVFVGCVGRSITTDDQNYGNMPIVRCAYMNGCYMYNATYMKGIDNVLLNYKDFYSSNNANHPNAVGMSALGYYINGFMNTNTAINAVYNGTPVTCESADSTKFQLLGDNTLFYQTVVNDTVELVNYSFSFIAKEQWNTRQHILNMPITYCNPNNIMLSIVQCVDATKQYPEGNFTAYMFMQHNYIDLQPLRYTVAAEAGVNVYVPKIRINSIEC